jgi:hypothetical protein
LNNVYLYRSINYSQDGNGMGGRNIEVAQQWQIGLWKNHSQAGRLN